MRVAYRTEDGEVENETDDLGSAVKSTGDDIIVYTRWLVVRDRYGTTRKETYTL